MSIFCYFNQQTSPHLVSRAISRPYSTPIPHLVNYKFVQNLCSVHSAIVTTIHSSDAVVSPHLRKVVKYYFGYINPIPLIYQPSLTFRRPWTPLFFLTLISPGASKMIQPFLYNSSPARVIFGAGKLNVLRGELTRQALTRLCCSACPAKLAMSRFSKRILRGRSQAPLQKLLCTHLRILQDGLLNMRSP